MSGWGSCPQCARVGLTCPGCGKCKKECCRCYPRTEIDSALVEDRDRLRKHVEETMALLALFGECEHGKECVPHAIAAVEQLREERDRFRDALEQIANPDQMALDTSIYVLQQLARQALEPRRSPRAEDRDAFRAGFEIAREMAAASIRDFLFEVSPGLQQRLRGLQLDPR